MDTDTFRKEKTVLTSEQSEWMDDVKDRAQELLIAIDRPKAPDFKGNRHIAVAKTNLEQAIMWAVKGITA